MARKVNRQCYTCGQTYQYCPSCREDSDKPRWMTLWDTEDCKIAFETTSDYLAKSIDAEKAREIFETIDLSNKENFEESIKNVIDDVMGGTKQRSKKMIQNKE